MPWPPAKKQLTIRLDEDVLAWLKRHGKGYQTRINRILRVVMESQPGRRAQRWSFQGLRTEEYPRRELRVHPAVPGFPGSRSFRGVFRRA